MALSLSNTFNQGVPPANPYTTATPGGNNNNNTTQHIQQVNNPSGDDGTGDENMEDSGNNNNGGGGNNNIGGGNSNLIFASELFHYEQCGVIRRTLLAIIKGSIVNPINLYNEQDKLAKKASHLTNVAHKQTLTDVADKTAEALEEEAAVDPKLVKVMILDGAETAVKKLMQQKNNNNSSKNKSGGGTIPPPQQKINRPINPTVHVHQVQAGGTEAAAIKAEVEAVPAEVPAAAEERMGSSLPKDPQGRATMSRREGEASLQEHRERNNGILRIHPRPFYFNSTKCSTSTW